MDYHLIRFESISHPPPQSGVTMERTFDSVQFSGSSDHSSGLTAERLEALRSLPIVRLAMAFMRLWKGCLMACIAFITIVLLIAVWKTNVLGGPQEVLIVLGFLIFFIGMTVTMLRISRVQSFGQGVAAGRGLVQNWQLTITRNDVEATEEFMGQAAQPRRCHPAEIRQISIGPQGSLIAQVADRSGETASPLALTGPLDQEDADWLADTLSQLFGLKP
ncbi:MAG: hypothetical protein GTO53_01030 [Planctomycetales bacterium]|nr:hypothetical protein [Planctomycetales bacterium]NIM07759.1 hypothetical protein [Planctomycetales bacterium]NIN07253.1 hypothetical protein [Planctomycetales bacterium]NIN76347.1 hypothetical protein [Planctomycetales bacterium]NIO33556.1 hypothetical protein [Planctomycetales bacterium]